ncbi:MAG: efflux RND transporter periplasmic adaptor subunit [Acetobacteraceae bacterium]
MRFSRTATLAAALVGAAAGGSGAAVPDISGQSFDCVIEPQQVVKLASSAVGVISRLDVDRGSIVRAGQFLGKLDDRVEAANLALAQGKAANPHDLAAAKARLVYQQKRFARASILVTTRLVSQNATDEAESEMKVAEQQVQSAELNQQIAALEVKQAEEVLRQRSFFSPVDGVVMERLLVPGEYRNDQSPIMTIAQINPLRVEVFLPAIYYGQVRPGSVATVTPDEPIVGTYQATVSIIDRVMDAASGTFGVRLELPNPELKLPGGLKCRIRFPTTRSTN